MAAWDQLAIATLALDDRLIAFEYALIAHGVYAPLKVAYDPRYKGLKPGQLLRWHLFRSLQADERWRGVDFVGPTSSATAAWATDCYRQCRLVIAQDRLVGRLLLAGYRLAQRSAPEPESSPAPRPLPALPIPAELTTHQ